MQRSCLWPSAFLPLAAWEVFSVVYFGFPFPNTAYSKLKTGVPAPEIHYQGFLYLLDSIANDPLTLFTIGLALVAPLAFGGGWSVPAGILVYLVYIVRVGGDFMSGRFLTAPFLLSVMWLSRGQVSEFRGAWALAITGIGIRRLERAAADDPLKRLLRFGHRACPRHRANGNHGRADGTTIRSRVC